MAIKNIALNIVGFISLFLGIIGIFIPVLPTTPFILLAITCFATSNRYVYNYIIENKYFGNTIKNYYEKKHIPYPTKIKAIIFLWTGLIISGLLINAPKIQLVLLIVGFAITTHIILVGRKK